jgi:hypothetical protein
MSTSGNGGLLDSVKKEKDPSPVTTASAPQTPDAAMTGSKSISTSSLKLYVAFLDKLSKWQTNEFWIKGAK